MAMTIQHKASQVYPLHGNANRKFVKTGEFREPRAGEYFLSGAIPEVYLTNNDLSNKYNIMRELTNFRTVTLFEEIE